jgi:predicted phosphohydrolase
MVAIAIPERSLGDNFITTLLDRTAIIRKFQGRLDHRTRHLQLFWRKICFEILSESIVIMILVCAFPDYQCPQGDTQWECRCSVEMKVQYCSDLHLEFSANRKYLTETPIEPTGDILLLAGDITPLAGIEKASDFFNFLSDNFEHSYWLPGNHEYYRSDITERSGAFHEKIRSNVSLVNNTVVNHGDIRLLFSTLWSKINPADGFVIQKSMADFRLIKRNGQRMTLDDYDLLYESCYSFLQQELEDSGNNRGTMVVTHHVPTFLNYPEQYKHSQLNSAFATELHDFIEASGADFWIYGHSHGAVPDFMIGKTTLTTNQLGYVEHGEHLRFQNGKLIGR